jgi:hypothetical protein
MYGPYGYDPYAGLHGDVMGADVMGDFEVVGYDEEGNEIVGRAPRRRRVPQLRRQAPRQAAIPVQRPEWRDGQLAPGVYAPDEGLVSLPLHGPAGDTFTSAIPRITFTGQLQKPFRGERLIVNTVRTGATAVGRLQSQLFVGTDLQQADIEPLDIEPLGDTGAFGVRLTMKPATPGVLIRFPTSLTSNLTGSDTILVSMQLLGRIVA